MYTKERKLSGKGEWNGMGKIRERGLEVVGRVLVAGGGANEGG